MCTEPQDTVRRALEEAHAAITVALLDGVSEATFRKLVAKAKARLDRVHRAITT